MAEVTIHAETQREDRDNLKIIVDNADEGTVFKYSKPRNGRTAKQNRALSVYCTLLATALNDAGLEMKIQFMGGEIDIPWTHDLVKDHIWRPVQIAMQNIESTTEADTSQYGEVHRVLARDISQKHGVYVPWPSKRG